MIARFLYFSCFFVVGTLAASVHAKPMPYKPISCSSISDIKKYLEPGCFVASDFDNTLFKEPRSILGKIAYWYSLYNRRPGSLSLEFIEPNETISLLQLIKDAHINFIVLTARTASTMDQTFSQLKNLLPVPFSFEPFQLCPGELKLTFQKRSAYYKQGILFGCYHNKGDVLSAFFDELKLNPTKVIFIDDKEKNIKDVAQAMEKRKVPFVGLHYAYVEAKEGKKFTVESTIA